MAGQATEKYKAMLKDASRGINDAGAFGVPWMVVTEDKEGRKEPFFGSDR